MASPRSGKFPVASWVSSFYYRGLVNGSSNNQIDKVKAMRLFIYLVAGRHCRSSVVGMQEPLQRILLA